MKILGTRARSTTHCAKQSSLFPTGGSLQAQEVTLPIKYVDVLHSDIAIVLNAFEANVFLKLSASSPNEYIFCVDIKKTDDGVYKCNVQLYKGYIYNPADLIEELNIANHSIINTQTDWFYHSKLWFKRKDGRFEPFISYIKEYRDIVYVQSNHPAMSFNIDI